MSLSPSTSLDVSVAMDTDIGRKRKQNQDAIGHLSPTDPDVMEQLGQIFVLADGVGGLAGGDLASQYAVSTIISSYYDQEEGEPPDRLARAIAEANNVIYAEGHGQETTPTMATTVVAAVIRDRELIIGSVGDSPAYLMRDASVRKLTLDHNLETQQREAGTPLVDGDPDGRKLVRALGSAPSVKVDIISGKVRGGDYVVLCSDGLTRYVTPEEIEQTVATLPVERASKALIELANERGGADNISIIVLHLSEDENLTQLPPIPDPMESWGRPRRAERARVPSPVQQRVRRPVLPADNPLRDLWHLMRGNTVLTGVGMSVLLVIFVIIMLIIATAGGDDNAKSGERADTPLPAVDRTATGEVIQQMTAQAAAAETTDAIQAATAAEVVRRTLTPPSPVPTYGPMLPEGIWFQVLDGDPIPAYQAAGEESDPATDLEAGQNFRVSAVDRATALGPWYQVVDNLGQEVRWVSAQALHARIVVIDTAGNPLPDSDQPVDVPPPGERRATSTPARTATPLPTVPGTPGTPATAARTPTEATPDIPYGVESWESGQEVTLKADLDLCRVPDVTACDAGEASSGESGRIVDGPVPSGDHWWWEVEFDDGRAGWIAQVLLGLS